VGPEAAKTLYQRVEDALKEWRISATLRMTIRDPAQGLFSAWREADQRVQEAKGLTSGAYFAISR